MITVRRNEDGIPTVWCDPCLEPLVRALNDGGVPTIASCCGHGLLPPNIALADGRVVVVVDSMKDHFGMLERWKC
jgi:hypothetical protein